MHQRMDIKYMVGGAVSTNNLIRALRQAQDQITQTVRATRRSLIENARLHGPRWTLVRFIKYNR